jgi:hypothetical protein
MKLRPATAIAVIVLSAGACLRLVNLDADPDYYDWVGYITDEGRWVQAARSLFLDGVLPGNRMGLLHLLLAPLFQAGAFASFSLAGVTLDSARLLPALSGCGILIVFWLMMRPVAGAETSLFGLSLLAFQTDLLALSRMAIPEVPMMLLALLVYWLVTTSRSAGGLLGGGLLTVFALTMKATSAALVPVATGIAAATSSRSKRLRSVALYWAGTFVLPVLAALGWLAISSHGLSGSVSDQMLLVRQFLGVSSLFSIVSFPFSSSLAWTFNACALSLWLSLLLLIVPARSHHIERCLQRHWVASAVWIGVFGPIMVTLSYFPTRYQVLLLLPLIVHLVSSLSAFSRVLPTSVVASFTGLAGWRGILWRIILVLPTAAFLGPMLAYPLAIAGLTPARLISKVAAIATAAFLLWMGAQWGRKSTRIVWWFMYLPPIAFVVAFLQSMFGMTFWLAESGAWPVGFFVSAGAAFAAAVQRPLTELGIRRLLIGAAVGVALIGCARESPRYLSPHYTIKAASEDLPQILAGCSTVRALKSEGLFNGNSVRYETRWYGEIADCLVATFLSTREADEIARDYGELLKSYEIFVSPTYCERIRQLSSLSPGDCHVIIEVRRSDRSSLHPPLRTSRTRLDKLIVDRAD